MVFSNLRNEVDFFLRNLLGWEGPRLEFHAQLERDKIAGKEIRTFLDGFRSSLETPETKLRTQGRLTVLDVGAKNFFCGPVIEKWFLEQGRPTEVHGIEVDAYRRYSSLHTRASFGRYYCQQMASGHFHAVDFLRWSDPADVILSLNPFVVPEPLQAWGLPMRFFKPMDWFTHMERLLRPKKGKAIVSAPSPEEFEICIQLAAKSGLIPVASTVWKPTKISLQRQPRYGVLFKCDGTR